MANKSFDLIVVGGGVLGVFHAYHALKKGLKVLLTEKDIRPQSATVRNFGQVVPSGMAGRWFHYGVRTLEVYQEIHQEFDITLRKNGSIYLASDPDEQQLLHEAKQIFDTRGYACELWSGQQCLQRWPVLKPSYIVEGLYFPDEVSVDPDMMIHRVIAFMQEKFPDFVYKSTCAALHVETGSNKASLTTSHGHTYAAKKIIVCNGSEFRILFPDLFNDSNLIVSKLQMMRTVPMPAISLPGNILTGLSIRRYESFVECPSFTSLETPAHYAELKKWGIHILFKQAVDGSIIIGDSHEYEPAGSWENLGFHVQQHINQLVLEEAQRIVNFDIGNISTSWAGYYSQHPREIFTRNFDNTIYIFTGIGGKGMTSSAGFAEENINALFG